MNEREREPGGGDQKRRAEPVPEPCREGNRRDVVVLEAEPTVPRKLLDAAHLVPCLMPVHQHERARRNRQFAPASVP